MTFLGAIHDRIVSSMSMAKAHLDIKDQDRQDMGCSLDIVDLFCFFFWRRVTAYRWLCDISDGLKLVPARRHCKA